jgi:hypothetical protein
MAALRTITSAIPTSRCSRTSFLAGSGKPCIS